MKAAWDRIKRLEARLGVGEQEDVEKALADVWAQFSDDEA